MQVERGDKISAMLSTHNRLLAVLAKHEKLICRDQRMVSVETRGCTTLITLSDDEVRDTMKMFLQQTQMHPPVLYFCLHSLNAGGKSSSGAAGKGCGMSILNSSPDDSA